MNLAGRKVKEKVPSSELHAYVDNCLSETKRKAIEARIAEDHELRRQVECWRAQSQAIRVAFGATAAPPAAPRRTLTSEKLKAALAEGAAAHSRNPGTQKLGQEFRRRRVRALARPAAADCSRRGRCSDVPRRDAPARRVTSC